MRKFFKLLFSRVTLVVIAILLQLCLSIIFPYVLNYFYPVGISNIYIPLDSILTIVALILLLRIINSDMNIEGQISWIVLVLLFPMLGIVLYFLFVRRRPPSKHKLYYKKMSQIIKPYLNTSKLEDINLKETISSYYGQLKYIQNATGLRTYENTNVKFLQTGEKFFNELLNELKNSSKRAHFLPAVKI